MASREAQAVARIMAEGQVPPDGVLFVHSAFRRLGAEGLRAEAFIEALLDHMRPGTLAMPAMSWRLVNAENPVFDEILTPSHVGVMPELFRARYATHRSLHPTHSVAAHGRLAAALTGRHHVDGTPCSINSPYGRAAYEETHILMLGAGLERCTAFHHPEEMNAPEIYLKPASEAESYELRGRDGAVHRMSLRRHARRPRDFPQFGPRLEAKGQMRQGQVLGTGWMAFAMADLYAELNAALRRDPKALLAGPDGPFYP